MRFVTRVGIAVVESGHQSVVVVGVSERPAAVHVLCRIVLLTRLATFDGMPMPADMSVMPAASKQRMQHKHREGQECGQRTEHQNTRFHFVKQPDQ